MRRKQIATLILSGVLALSMSFTAFAGQWKQDESGQWVELAEGQDTTGSVHHNDGYNPAAPLAGKIDEWNLRLPRTTLTGFDICTNNVQAMLTGQMDQYFAAPVGEWINPETGTKFYTEQEDYDWARNNEQVLYEWFCNWLNSMDFENMSEMERAKEIQKVLKSAKAPRNGYDFTNQTYQRVLIEKQGYCAELRV